MALVWLGIGDYERYSVACCGVSCHQGLCYCRGPSAEQFSVFPGQRLLLQFYACAVTHGRTSVVLLCIVFGAS